MTQFTVTITDASALAGITADRTAHNASLVLSAGQSVEDHADYQATDAAYVQFVMSRAAESYASRHGT